MLSGFYEREGIMSRQLRRQSLIEWKHHAAQIGKDTVTRRPTACLKFQHSCRSALCRLISESMGHDCPRYPRRMESFLQAGASSPTIFGMRSNGIRLAGALTLMDATIFSV